MSKLQELIKELCPDGVEFRKLGEVCEIKRGVRVVKNDLINDGKYPVFQNSLIPLGYYDKNNYPANITFVISAGAAGEIGYTEEPIWAADDCLTIISPNNIINKFIYYCLIANKLFFVSKVRRASVPRLSRTVVDNFEIPIPPLEIQSEIVRILDTFTAHTAELQAELQARKEQYEYYRNKLLTFDENDERVKWMTLGEVSVNVCSGGTPSTSNKKYYQGHIPWLRTQEVDWKDVFYTKIKISEDAIKNSSAKIIPPNCVIVAMYGATAGKTCINKIPLTTNQACCNLEINKDIALYKYVYYWLYKEYYKLKALGEGSQSNISGKKIKSYAIPIPPLSEQQRIISILDKFESLVNDLSEGLPAEIAAVQEQYEYYRNKLLTFKRKS